jgi:hypothetical protein
VPSAFFSVSLSAANVDEESAAEARATADDFIRETGWQLDPAETTAGTQVYTQHNFFIRHLMKAIAKGALRARHVAGLGLRRQACDRCVCSRLCRNTGECHRRATQDAATAASRCAQTNG